MDDANGCDDGGRDGGDGGHQPGGPRVSGAGQTRVEQSSISLYLKAQTANIPHESGNPPTADT